MYLIKLYQGEGWAGAYYEAEAEARMGFEGIRGHLGNPFIRLGFSAVIEGQEVGEMRFGLGPFDRAELVELTVTDEKILGSHDPK